MKFFCAQTRVEAQCAFADREWWGEMNTPRSLPPYRLTHGHALDNLAFSWWKAGLPFGGEIFSGALRASRLWLDGRLTTRGDFLEAMGRQVRRPRCSRRAEAARARLMHADSPLPAPVRPDFVVVPDIVAGGWDSLRFSLSWLERCQALGCLLMLVVQDGMTREGLKPYLHHFGGIFVGGSTAWKWRTAREWMRFASDHGMAGHIGRATSEDLVRQAREAGATSCDSSEPVRKERNAHSIVRGMRVPLNYELPWGLPG